MANVVFLDATQLANGIAGMSRPAPPPEPTSTGAFVSVRILNQTQFEFTPDSPPAPLSSGAITPAVPPSVSPFGNSLFIGTPVSTPHLATGVTGAVSFTLPLLPNVLCRLGVGFGDPVIGPYGANVAFDADYNQPMNSGPVLDVNDFVQGTYEGNNSGTTTTKSAIFSGTDANGVPTEIQISGTSEVENFEITVIVTQNIISGGT